jgi:hypothetical protein
MSAKIWRVLVSQSVLRRARRVRIGPRELESACCRDLVGVSSLRFCDYSWTVSPGLHIEALLALCVSPSELFYSGGGELSNCISQTATDSVSNRLVVPSLVAYWGLCEENSGLWIRATTLAWIEPSSHLSRAQPQENAPGLCCLRRQRPVRH